jgi:hypothetical protein
MDAWLLSILRARLHIPPHAGASRERSTHDDLPPFGFIKRCVAVMLSLLGVDLPRSVVALISTRDMMRDVEAWGAGPASLHELITIPPLLPSSAELPLRCRWMRRRLGRFVASIFQQPEITPTQARTRRLRNLRALRCRQSHQLSDLGMIWTQPQFRSPTSTGNFPTAEMTARATPSHTLAGLGEGSHDFAWPHQPHLEGRAPRWSQTAARCLAGTECES